MYQTYSQYCDSRYSLLVNNTYLSVPNACPLSCNTCISVQRMNEMNPLTDTKNDGNATMIEEEYITASTMTTNFQQNTIFSRSEKCFDKRDDCLLQKQYGFCEIFNEKYPYDCTRTCNPDCISQS